MRKKMMRSVELKLKKSEILKKRSSELKFSEKIERQQRIEETWSYRKCRGRGNMKVIAKRLRNNKNDIT
jgi:hypothetical protein